MQANRAISVIIPCWHDHAALAALLARLNGLAQRARQQLQLLVVDAANSPDCQRICNQLGAQWLASAPCRGQQLRQGIQFCGFCMPMPSCWATHCWTCRR